MKRLGGFLSSPQAVAALIFALMLLVLYGMLTGNVGLPMLEWAKSAVPEQIQQLLAGVGC